MKFSDRPPQRAGGDEVWDRAEAALREACASAGVEPTLNPGDGRLLRPEAGLRRCATRSAGNGSAARSRWTSCCRSGWAPSMSPRTAARRTPVMLHRAILGSFERFLGVLIEHYAGRFPLWLAPVQAVVATIVSDADGYAREVADVLRRAGLEVELDLSNQKINAKVREHSLAHVPVLAVVGRREAEQRTVALRRLGGEAQEVLPLDEAVRVLAAEATPPDLREESAAQQAEFA